MTFFFLWAMRLRGCLKAKFSRLLPAFARHYFLTYFTELAHTIARFTLTT